MRALDRNPDRACLRKRKYPSQKAARIAIAFLAKNGSTGLSFYHCPWCQTWHVGHRGFRGDRPADYVSPSC